MNERGKARHEIKKKKKKMLALARESGCETKVDRPFPHSSRSSFPFHPIFPAAVDHYFLFLFSVFFWFISDVM